MGGGSVGRAVNTAVSVVTAPITAPLKVAEIAAPELTKAAIEKAQGIPVVSTATNAAVGLSDLAPSALRVGLGAEGAQGELKSNVVNVAKGAVLAGGASLGAAALGGSSLGAVGGLSAVDTVIKQGLSLSSLASLGEGFGFLPEGASKIPGAFNPPAPKSGPGGGGAAPALPSNKTPVYSGGRSQSDFTILFAVAVIGAALFVSMRR